MRGVVPEVWIIDRDSKAPEVHVHDAGRHEKQLAVEEGWISSAATGIPLRPASGTLAAEMIGEPATRRLLPED